MRILIYLGTKGLHDLVCNSTQTKVCQFCYKLICFGDMSNQNISRFQITYFSLKQMNYDDTHYEHDSNEDRQEYFLKYST